MSVGSLMRRALGPATDPVARFYRKWYIDLHDFGRVLSHFGHPRRVVEIGCGDGHLTERLVAELPDAEVLGIDVADEPGRLYRGDASRARFERMSTADLARREPASFDLVVICDVLHHVPVDERAALLREARQLVTSGGHIVVKDWVSTRNLGTLAAYLSDRYITGDRIRFFEDRDQFVDTVMIGCAPGVVVAEGRVPPKANNLYVALRPV